MRAEVTPCAELSSERQPACWSEGLARDLADSKGVGGILLKQSEGGELGDVLTSKLPL